MLEPRLITFDIFGTVLDWRTGLLADLRNEGVAVTAETFDRIIDIQGREEQRLFRPYRDIVAASLSEATGLAGDAAIRIGNEAGRWPLYADSESALRRIKKKLAIVATTNSDRVHGEQVQRQLDFRFTDWICAEEMGFYKPSPEVWRYTAKRRDVPLNKLWWHVSAYADYDLEVARSLGLTTVFIRRPHAREGRADYTFDDLESFSRFVLG